MLTDLFAIMAPTLFATLAGWLWAKRGWEYPSAFVSKMVMMIGTPCLVVSAMSKVTLSSQLMADVALAFFAVLAVTALLGAIFLWLLRWDMRAFLPTLVFPNNGNMGLPLCLFAFGEAGLALGLGAFMVMLMAQLTLGLAWMAPHQAKQAWWRILLHPVVLAMVFSVVMLLAKITLPLWLANTTALLGGFAIPLMMITLGVSLARFSLRYWEKALWLSLFRVLGGALIGVGVCYGLNITGIARSVVVLQAAMPMAVMNYVLALEYNRRPDEVAAMVLLSTLLSFAFLPALIFWLRF